MPSELFLSASLRRATVEGVSETVIAEVWCRIVLDDASRRWAAAEPRARDVCAAFSLIASGATRTLGARSAVLGPGRGAAAPMTAMMRVTR